MPCARRLAPFVLILAVAAIPLLAKDKKLTVQGKLTRAMAMGGESTGWSIELNPVITVGGKQLSSLEVKASDPMQLESLENKTVQAKGTLTYVSGTETSGRPVLVVSSVKELKPKAEDKPRPSLY